MRFAGIVVAPVLSPDNTLVLVTTDERMLVAYDVMRQRSVWTANLDQPNVAVPVFTESPDGTSAFAYVAEVRF